MNITNIFKDKFRWAIGFIFSIILRTKERVLNLIMCAFRTTAETIMSDNISAIEKKSICILDDSNQLIDSLTCQVEKHLNLATVSEGSESFKKHSKKIGKILRKRGTLDIA